MIPVERPGKEEYEAEIARRLCARLGRGWALVETKSPPHPDCIIGCGEFRVAVELVQYRQQGPENAQHTRDEDFKWAVHEAWLHDDSVNEYALFLQYRRDGPWSQVPRARERAAVIEDLKELVREEHRWGEEGGQVMFLEGSERDFEFPHSTELRPVWGSSRYPRLVKYFQLVDVRRYPGTKMGLPSTSLGGMFLGLDDEELQRVVGDHLSKVSAYREATELPVWLVVHSDGHPISASVPAPHVKRAIAVASEASTPRADGGFDGALWLDEPFSTSDSRLWMIRAPILPSGIVIRFDPPPVF